MSVDTFLIAAAIFGFVVFWYLCRTAPVMVEETPDDQASENGVVEQLHCCSDPEAELADSSVADQPDDHERKIA